MAIPVCIALPDVPSRAELRLPGGATLEALNKQIMGMQSVGTMQMELLSMVNPALTPMKPIFDIIGTVAKLVECVQLIPDAITNPLKVSQIVQCFPEVLRKVDQLLQLIPIISIPLTLLDILDNIIIFLQEVINAVNRLVALAASLANRVANAQSVNDPNLDTILGCAQVDLEKQQASLSEAVDALGAVLAMFNLLAGLIGVAPVELDIDFGTGDISDALEPLEALVQTLQDVRKAIPLP